MIVRAVSVGDMFCRQPTFINENRMRLSMAAAVLYNNVEKNSKYSFDLFPLCLSWTVCMAIAQDWPWCRQHCVTLAISHVYTYLKKNFIPPPTFLFCCSIWRVQFFFRAWKEKQNYYFKKEIGNLPISHAHSTNLYLFFKSLKGITIGQVLCPKVGIRLRYFILCQ
jgi:hypothetical protein